MKYTNERSLTPPTQSIEKPQFLVRKGTSKKKKKEFVQISNEFQQLLESRIIKSLMKTVYTNSVNLYSSRLFGPSLIFHTQLSTIYSDQSAGFAKISIFIHEVSPAKNFPKAWLHDHQSPPNSTKGVCAPVIF